MSQDPALLTSPQTEPRADDRRAWPYWVGAPAGAVLLTLYLVKIGRPLDGIPLYVVLGALAGATAVGFLKVFGRAIAIGAIRILRD